MSSPPGPKLNAEQRDQLLEWLAADYAWALIVQWFTEREWPDITRQTASYYRTRYCREVEARAKARRDSALATGLALREERVARLKAHADKLEAIKWEPDERGRLWNEKAWRETLDDIAKETGGRVQKTEVMGKDGAAIELRTRRDLSGLSDEKLALLETLLTELDGESDADRA